LLLLEPVKQLSKKE
jgi:hypothetical protein